MTRFRMTYVHHLRMTLRMAWYGQKDWGTYDVAYALKLLLFYYYYSTLYRRTN